MGNLLQKPSVQGDRPTDPLEELKKEWLTTIDSPVRMYRNGLLSTSYVENVDYEALVKAKLQTKKAVVPFSYKKTVAEEIIKSETPIFIQGRLCELWAEKVKKANPVTGKPYWMRIFYLKEVALLLKDKKMTQKEINRKLLLRRKHPFSGLALNLGSYGYIYGSSRVAITNKGNERFIILYQRDGSFHHNFGSGSLIDPIRRKTLIRLPNEVLKVPSEHYNFPRGLETIRSKFDPSVKFETAINKENQKRVYLSQIYSNLTLHDPYKDRFVYPMLVEQNEFLQLKRILKRGIGKIGHYYDLQARKVVDAGIEVQRGLELPGTVEIDQFVASLMQAANEQGLEQQQFFCRKSYHLRRPNTFLYVYIDPISKKFFGLKKELKLEGVSTKDLEHRDREFEPVPERSGHAEGDPDNQKKRGIPSSESVLFEVKFSKTNLKNLKTLKFEVQAKSFEMLILKDFDPMGLLIDLKATDLSRQGSLIQWIKGILDEHQRKFPEKTSDFLRGNNNFLSCDYIYYFNTLWDCRDIQRPPVYYLVFVKDFESCDFEVVDLTGVVWGK